jgi:hypothetical protein
MIFRVARQPSGTREHQKRSVRRNLRIDIQGAPSLNGSG